MAKEKTLPNARCERAEHSRHLCSLADQYFHVNNPDEFRAMVINSEFKCQFCGRTANDRDGLCYPIEL